MCNTQLCCNCLKDYFVQLFIYDTTRITNRDKLLGDAEIGKTTVLSYTVEGWLLRLPKISSGALHLFLASSTSIAINEFKLFFVLLLCQLSLW